MFNLIRTHYETPLGAIAEPKTPTVPMPRHAIPERAAILIELGFHDSCDRDALYLRDRFFQSLTMWGAYKGVCDYWASAPPTISTPPQYVSDTIPAEMDPGRTTYLSITFRTAECLD
jgi:hypothetical protein